MNPNKKAEELIRKFYTFGIRKEGQSLSWDEAKQCALICVDEIIEMLSKAKDLNMLYRSDLVVYWQQVKQLIINKK